jgi:hypothetical protein
VERYSNAAMERVLDEVFERLSVSGRRDAFIA